MPDNTVKIIGVGAEGPGSLTPAALSLVNAAEILIGGERLLSLFPDAGGRKLTVKTNLAEVSEAILQNMKHKRIVFIASGDPGFYGIARSLIEKLGKAVIEIIPNVTSLQLAFARIKESWDDAELTSVHSRPIEDIVGAVRSSCKIGILTDNKNTPGKIALTLEQAGIENCSAYVCENLGAPDERVTLTNLYDLKESEFSPFNVLILMRQVKEEHKQLFGIDDLRFNNRREGLITKSEVRAASLAKLAIRLDSILWDIGAGTGAVSIEAAGLASHGQVFAIEKNPESVPVIMENINKFGRYNIRVIVAEAPNRLDDLPEPNAVFIGGSSGNMKEIISVIKKRLQPEGRIVINAATLETLQEALKSLDEAGFASEVSQINISRSKEIAGLTRLEALNPVFVITGERENDK